MLYPSIMKLMEKTGSRYSLVIATAKRVREIEKEAQEEKNCGGARTISKAATEIADGDIVVYDSSEDDKIIIEEIEE